MGSDAGASPAIMMGIAGGLGPSPKGANLLVDQLRISTSKESAHEMLAFGYEFNHLLPVEGPFQLRLRPEFGTTTYGEKKGMYAGASVGPSWSPSAPTDTSRVSIALEPALGIGFLGDRARLQMSLIMGLEVTWAPFVSFCGSPCRERNRIH